jgi:adenine/guanine/hypoxanthine permease
MGWIFHISHFYGVFSVHPWAGGYHGFEFDFKPLMKPDAWPVVFTFLMVALFDSTGTMLGLSHQMGQQELSIPRLNRALLAESIATTFSACVGGTTTAAFLESASGIKVGGRTGVTAITTGVLFLLMLFLYPLARSVPAYATASGLFYVSCLMVRPFSSVDWSRTEEFIPAVMTLLMIPLTFSIADGVGLGLICYVVLKISSGKFREIPWILGLLTLVFLMYFLF